MNRFYQSVVVDYVTGMDQHSYLFGKANQLAYRPLLERLLIETGMQAPTPLAARYGLRVEFKDLEGSAIGTDFTARSIAVYRIVNRMTGETVFEREVPAQFTAIFPGLNEHDFALAYKRLGTSVPLLEAAGYAYAATQHSNHDIATGQGWILSPEQHTDFIKFYQSSIAFAVYNELSVGWDFVRPSNFIAWANFSGRGPRESVLAAPKGLLSENGIGSRDGTERQKQADFMMMGQSLTKFVIAASDAEHVRFITLLPCGANIEVDAIKDDLQAHGMLWETDECEDYQRLGPNRPGATYTSGQ